MSIATVFSLLRQKYAPPHTATNATAEHPTTIKMRPNELELELASSTGVTCVVGIAVGDAVGTLVCIAKEVGTGVGIGVGNDAGALLVMALEALVYALV